MSVINSKFVTFLISFFSVLACVNSAKILCIYPVPFHSHQYVFQALTRELARQGHELVVLTPLPFEKPVINVTEINVHDLSYSMWEKSFAEAMAGSKTVKVHPISLWSLAYPIMNKMLDAQLSVPKMQEIIKDRNQKFDLILIESVIKSSLIVRARFEAPVIMVSPYYGITQNYFDIGAPVDPIIMPDFNKVKRNNITFWDKLDAIYTDMVIYRLAKKSEEEANEIAKKHFGVNAPPISELKNHIQMLLLNVHHIWDNNRPVPPSVVYLGALHLREPKEIPQDLKTYLDNSKHGVIYVSLGSKIKSSELPPDILRVIQNVLSSLPYDVLWKWEADEMPGRPKNVRIAKWFPQNDLLHHPSIKAFIMQGGLQSTDEAIAANVPLIALPIFSDQFTNAQRFEEFGIGIELDIDNLREADLKQAILDVITKQSYKDNMKELGRIMAAQRLGALEKATFWIDYIAKHGGQSLRSPLAKQSYVEYYCDIIVAAVSIVLAVFIIVVTAIKILCAGKKQRKLKTK